MPDIEVLDAKIASALYAPSVWRQQVRVLERGRCTFGHIAGAVVRAIQKLGGGIGEAYRQLNLNCLTPVFLGHRLFQKNTQICSLTVCQTRGRSIQLGLIITHVKQNMLVLRRHLAVGNGWARRA